MILRISMTVSLNSIKQLVFAIEMRRAVCEARTEVLNVICMNLGFKS
jgi:hypothetical protein